MIEINSAMPVAAIKLVKTGLPQKLDDLKELELRTTLRIPFDTNQIRSKDKEKTGFDCTCKYRFCSF